MRAPCSLWAKRRRETPSSGSIPRQRARQRERARSPSWPKGVWPRSCPRAMASVRSSLSRSARAMVRAIWETSSVWVRHLGHLEGVDEPRAVVVPLGGQKHLRLVGKPAKALAVEDAVPVALEAGAQGVRLLGGGPSQGLHGQAPKRAEKDALPLLEVNPADECHRASK